MTVVERLLTAEEFWGQYAETRVELIRGRLDLDRGGDGETMTNAEHGKIAALLVAALVPFARQRDLGWIRVEAHYQLGEDTLRVPDVSFLSQEREAQIPDPTRYIPFAPEMAIEVISPSETHTAVRDKINDYRAAGTDVMWLVYPNTKEVEVHYLGQDRIVRFGADDTLRLEMALPGFELPLKQIFVD